jgi:hypothetical protein
MLLNIGGLKVRFYRNSASGAPKWDIKHLPIKQTLVWMGPLFILIQRRAG